VILYKPLASIGLFPSSRTLGITGALDRVTQKLNATSAPLCSATNDGERTSALNAAVTDELAKPSPKGKGLQSTIMAAIEDAAYERIHSLLPHEGKSVLEASSTKGAYAYGTTAPTCPAMRLTRKEMRTAFNRRVMMPAIAPGLIGTLCPRCTRSRLTADGSHAFACSGPGKHFRHNCLAQANVAMARSAGASARGASCADVSTPYNPNSAPDVFIAAPGLDNIVTDVSWVISERGNLSGLVKQRAKVKNDLYLRGARETGNTFIPFLVNNKGGIATDGLNLMKQLSYVAAENSADAEVASLFAPYWHARISVLAQKLAADAIQWIQHPYSAHERKVGTSKYSTASAASYDAFVESHASSGGGAFF
jgi:hypothetical protein